MAAQKVLLIEPRHFFSNPQTAGDNFFQQTQDGISLEEVDKLAKNEFDTLVELLTKAGIEASVFRQDDSLITPDAVFPNNWFSTMPDRTLILYPMMAENRRLERRASIISELLRNYRTLIDLTHDENRGIFLEGTGSIVIDHPNKTGYASLSERTSSNMLFEWSRKTGYEIVMFASYDRNQQTIYHTNVLMTLAEKFAIVCVVAITDYEGRDRIISSIVKSGREIIEITLEQMHSFCGNCLELENKKGEKFLVMSSQAFGAFTQAQKDRIAGHTTILHTPLDTIEKHGGGSARCMLAELF